MKKKKIAIIFNEKNGLYEGHYYSIRFRIFGVSTFGWIAMASSEEGLIRELHKKIYGKLIFIRIVEV